MAGPPPIVAVERARECREARDYESALTWLEVALLVGRDIPRAAMPAFPAAHAMMVW
jgi:hypothetical protein